MLNSPNIVLTVIHTLHNRLITNMDKYMQEAEKACKSDDNYFDAVTRSTNTSPMPETPALKSAALEQDLNNTENSQQAKQLMQNILESLNEDTGQPTEEPDKDNKADNPDSNSKHLDEL